MPSEPPVALRVISRHERVSARLVLLVPLLLLIALPVQAQGTSKVQGYLISVNRLYEDLEYEQALGQIDRARRFPRTPEEDVALSLYEGIILADMNRWEEAVAAFNVALSLDPAARLPVKVSPKVEQRFEALRQEALRAQPPPQPTPAPPPVAVTTPRGEPKPPSLGSGQAAPVARTAPAEATQRASPSPLRPRVLIPAVGGGVLMIAGSTSWMLSRRELSRLRENDPDIASRKEARSTASRGRTYQTVGVGLLGAGLVSLGAAAGLYALGLPPRELSLGVGTDGTSAFVQGRWP